MNRKAVAITLALVAVVGIGVFALTNQRPPVAQATPAAPMVKVQNQNLVIPIASVTATPTFYPAQVDGVKLEVIAVRTPDGVIRTAFNTCQVCYSSGRGYYKQVGKLLVCQNCGNRFSTDQIEVASGGCNLVPIFPANKTVDSVNITISNEFLRETKAIFANWKKY